MHIRRFEGPSMPAVLAEIRQEMGAEALILSSRKIRKAQGIFGLLSRTLIEVQAATDRKAGARKAESSPDQGRIESLQREVERLSASRDFETELRAEIRGLKEALQTSFARRASDSVDSAAESMSLEGLDWSHAESVTRSWRELDSEEGHRSLEDFLAQRIERRLVVPRTDEGDRLHILVGAPGVGKTTSIAKLAARNEEGERDVALACLDQFRMGATAPLRDYAELLGAPFCEMREVADLPGVIERFPGCSVLVDTAGRSAGDGPPSASLSNLRSRLGKRFCVDLVIDATAKRRVQRAQIERFAPLAPDRLLLTKTDECDSLVDIANLALDEDTAPICWLGTGQRVPEDLELADARLLARSALGRGA